MILQAIVAPLPVFLITLGRTPPCSGAPSGAGAPSWVQSHEMGAGLCFCIARGALGREVVGGIPHRLRGGCRAVPTAISPALARGRRSPWVCRLCCRLSGLTWSAMPPDLNLAALLVFMLANNRRKASSPATIVYFLGPGVCAHRGTFWLATGLSLLLPGRWSSSLHRQKYLYRERRKRSSPRAHPRWILSP